jgi:hypothetical protein
MSGGVQDPDAVTYFVESCTSDHAGSRRSVQEHRAGVALGQRCAPAPERREDVEEVRGDSLLEPGVAERAVLARALEALQARYRRRLRQDRRRFRTPGVVSPPPPTKASRSEPGAKSATLTMASPGVPARAEHILAET